MSNNWLFQVLYASLNVNQALNYKQLICPNFIPVGLIIAQVVILV